MARQPGVSMDLQEDACHEHVAVLIDTLIRKQSLLAEIS